MQQTYRLIFKGEVLDGQHQAVVQRRLVVALKLDDAAAGKLFAGAPVVLKKAATEAEAEHFQTTFTKAGARLHIIAETAAQKSELPSPAAAEFQLAPLGANLLRPGEIQQPAPVNVDISHLHIAELGADLLPEKTRHEELADLDLSHLQLVDEPGHPSG